MSTRRVVLGALLAAAVPGSISGQTVEGRVTEDLSDLPLEAAQVRLLDADGATAAATVTDSLGRYRLAPIRTGSYQIVVDLFGYRSLSTPLMELTGERAVQADFELPVDPVELEGLRVEAEAVRRIEEDLRMFGVRMQALGERFVGPSAIQARPTARDFGKVLQWQSIPGMTVLRSDDVTPQPRRPFICVRLKPGRGGCAVMVLDGARVSLTTAYFIPPESLRAIVVLKPDEATLLYGTDGGTGAVLLFTRLPGG